MDPFVQQVLKTIRREKMLCEGEAVLVAFSGGPDSTALLLALQHLADTLKVRLVVAHFNHGFRAGAGEVQARCQRLAGTLGLPFLAGGPDGLDPQASNWEQKARVARYAFLHRSAQEMGCQKIATGHTLDDQAETVLLRLLRGSGIGGLAAIRPVRRDGVIRPLIDVSRAEVLAFLERAGLSYDRDETNENPRFSRVRVRAEVLPVLERMNPCVRRSLARLATAARWQADATSALLDGKLEEMLAPDGSLTVLPLLAMPLSLRVMLLRHWLQRVLPEDTGRLGYEASRRLVESLQSGPLVARLTADFVTAFLRNRDAHGQLAAGHRGKPNMSHADWGEYTLRTGGPQGLPGGFVAWVANLTVRDAGETSVETNLASQWIAVFPYGEWIEAEGLKFRPVRPGDRIDPLGTTGSKKLQDVFVDRKVPVADRWGRPALVAGNTILWVPGVIRSRHRLVHWPEAQEILKIWVAYGRSETAGPL